MQAPTLLSAAPRAPLLGPFLLAIDAVPVFLVGIGDRLLAFAAAVALGRASLRLRRRLARGAGGLGSGGGGSSLVGGRALGRAVLGHRFSGSSGGVGRIGSCLRALPILE